MKKYTRLLPLLIGMSAIPTHALAGDQAAMSEIMKRRMNRVAMIPDTLQNTGFEEVGAAGRLPGWTAVVHTGNSYRIEPDQSQAFGGKHSLVIENTGKPEWGGAIQTIRAEGLAGQEVELSVRLKTQGVTAPGFSLMLKIMQMGRELEIVKAQDPFIGDADWQAVSLRTKLPKETTHLEIILTLAGDGRVWVDDVSVGPLAEKQ